MPGRNDPNDPAFKNKPGYQFVNGQWQIVGGSQKNLAPGSSPGQMGNTTGGPGDEYKTGFADNATEFWNDPNSDWTRDWANAGKAMDDVGTALGYAPKHADANAPGGMLDTSQADEERAKQELLVGQLQQQAATGGGAWEGSLADATKKAQSNAQSLGQSQPGQDYATALDNIGNARAGSQQRAVGQGNILRAQSKQGAQEQLSNLLGSENGSDAEQAASRAQAQQGITQLNAALTSGANKQQTKDTEGMGGMLTSLMSSGGKVPGKPEVFGDDSRNDTVKAKLSPGEIVIPRSHASSPEAAADFVRALKSGNSPPLHFDGGGTVPGDGSGLSNADPNSTETANARGAGVVSILLPHVGAAMRQTKQSGPTVENGGLLQSDQYNSSRANQVANSEMLAKGAAGNGPSAAGQQIQNSSDENMIAAMQAGAHGGGLSSGDILQKTTAATQGAAGNAAAQTAQDQARAQGAYTSALVAQRARDSAFALAQQQAAFRQTQMNAGLGIEQQAAMRGLMAGAGQAAMAGSSAAGGRDKSYDLNDKNTPEFDQGLNLGGFESYPGEGSGSSGPADLHDSNDKWAGGYIKKYAKGGQVEDSRAADFVEALRRSM